MPEDYTFVIRPWAPAFKKFYNTLKPVWRNLNFPKLVDFDEVPKGPTLYDGIRARIHGASYVITDISLGLANIYWEYAYALALGKPILLCRTEGGKLIGESRALFSKLEDVLRKSFEANASELITGIIGRHFNIASDVAGTLYHSYQPNDFKGTRKRAKIISLKRKADEAFVEAYKRQQISVLTPSQLEKYLEIEAEGKTNHLLLYYRCDRHDNTLQIANIPLGRILEAKAQIDRLVFHFDEEPINEKLFRNLIASYDEIGVTHLKYNWKFVIVGKDYGFFSPNGKDVIFCRHRSLQDSIGKIRSDLSESVVSVESVEMLKQMVKMQEQIGLKDVRSLQDNGFVFDDYSELWVVGPTDILNYISNTNDANSLCGVLQDQISDHFAQFAMDYLNEANYILAFWPLTEEGINLAFGNKPPIEWWIKKLNSWARNKEKQGNNHSIDRFFVIPRSHCELMGNQYSLKDNGYRKLLKDFFAEGFKIDNCTYRKNVFVIFDVPQVAKSIFDRESAILKQNAILFSRDKYRAEKYRGVLQFEEPIELERVGSRILNFRYWKLPKDIDSRNGRIHRLLIEIRKIKKALVRVPKALRTDCPAIIRVDQFLKDYLGT